MKHLFELDAIKKVNRKEKGKNPKLSSRSDHTTKAKHRFRLVRVFTFAYSSNLLLVCQVHDGFDSDNHSSWSSEYCYVSNDCVDQRAETWYDVKDTESA